MNSILRCLLTTVLWCTAPALRFIDTVFPRCRRKVLFTSKAGLYHDNPKYLFEYVQQLNSWRPIWISRSIEDYELLRNKYGPESVLLYRGWLGALKLLYHYLTAAVVVIRGGGDLWEIRRYLSTHRRVVINLNHGPPVKRIGVLIAYFDKKSVDRNINQEIKRRRSVTYYTVSSDIERYFRAASYFVDVRHFRITGDPRNDRLIKLVGRELEVRNYIAGLMDVRASFSKVILYAPTHRDANILGTSALTTPTFFPFSDFNAPEMTEFLEANDALLLLRTHSEDSIYGGDRKNVDGSLFENERIRFCSHFVLRDVNEILCAVDLLWTDYSGIYLDYLLCNKPIVFIPYDIEEYDKIRGFLFDYALFTPGPKVTSFHDLLAESQKALDCPELYEKERLFVRRIFHKYTDGNACQRIVELFHADPKKLDPTEL